MRLSTIFSRCSRRPTLKRKDTNALAPLFSDPTRASGLALPHLQRHTVFSYRDAMFSGAKINITEGRAVLPHP